MIHPLNLKAYGVDRVIDTDNVCDVDFSGVSEKDNKFILVFEKSSGEKLKVNFPDKASAQHVLDGIANNQVKL